MAARSLFFIRADQNGSICSFRGAYTDLASPPFQEVCVIVCAPLAAFFNPASRRSRKHAGSPPLAAAWRAVRPRFGRSLEINAPKLRRSGP